MTDVVFWQNQSSSCNPWLKENLKLLSSPSLIIQAERHLTNLLISTLVPYTGPAWLSRYPLLFSSSYSSDLVVSFATQHHVAWLPPPPPQPRDLFLTCLRPLMSTWQVAEKIFTFFFPCFWWDLVPLSFCFLPKQPYVVPCSPSQVQTKLSSSPRHPIYCWGCPIPVPPVLWPFRAQILKTSSKLPFPIPPLAGSLTETHKDALLSSFKLFLEHLTAYSK